MAEQDAKANLLTKISSHTAEIAAEKEQKEKAAQEEYFRKQKAEQEAKANLAAEG